MKRERKDYPTITTPRGVVVWSSLNEPDFKYKEEFGEYHVKVRFDPSDPQVQELILGPAEEILQEAFEDKKKELEQQKKGAALKALRLKDEILAIEVDRETGEETGFVTLNARMNAGGRRKSDGKVWKRSPDIFNGQGQRLKNPPKIGSGSEIKVGVRVMDYYFPKDKEIGVRFELEAAQILKLVAFGQRDASSYGFGAEEDAEMIEDQADYGFGADDGGNDSGGGDDATDY